MKVIALTGASRAGKGTAAELMIDALREVDGVYAKVEGFADRLKVSAARALGYNGDDQFLIEVMDELKVDGIVTSHIGDGTRDLGITGRSFLQRYGTEAHRDVFGDDFWVDAVLPPTLDRNDCDLLIVHDLRFPNEVQRVRQYGGEVWRVNRPGVGDEKAKHVSEQVIDGDLVIDNSHGLNWLRAGVEVALEPFIGEFQERQQTLGVLPR